MDQGRHVIATIPIEEGLDQVGPDEAISAGDEAMHRT